MRREALSVRPHQSTSNAGARPLARSEKYAYRAKRQANVGNPLGQMAR